MKASIAITLIITGALLIGAPILADHLQRAQLAEILRNDNAQQVNLGTQMSEMYRFGCWMVGSLMVGAAIISSRERRPQSV
jgi:hypothetical protein